MTLQRLVHVLRLPGEGRFAQGVVALARASRLTFIGFEAARRVGTASRQQRLGW